MSYACNVANVVCIFHTLHVLRRRFTSYKVRCIFRITSRLHTIWQRYFLNHLHFTAQSNCRLMLLFSSPGKLRDITISQSKLLKQTFIIDFLLLYLERKQYKWELYACLNQIICKTYVFNKSSWNYECFCSCYRITVQ